MEQLEFIATLVETHEDESALVASLAADESGTAYLTFQRDPESGCEDDWGVYVEFDDHINSGYNRIKGCSIIDGSLAVEFSEPIDHEKRYDAIQVHIDLTTDELDSFVSMLRRIFTDYESLLTIEGAS